LIPTGFTSNQKPLITISDIYEAMSKMAFSIWEENEDGTIERLHEFDATKESKLYSIENGVDIEKIRKQVIGKIELYHVTAEHDKKFSAMMTEKEEINKGLDSAIQNKDPKLLKYFIKKFKKGSFPELDELVELAENTLEQINENPEPEPEQKPEPKKEITSRPSSMIAQRRRK
jgi:hypothetical protein